MMNTHKEVAVPALQSVAINPLSLLVTAVNAAASSLLFSDILRDIAVVASIADNRARTGPSVRVGGCAVDVIEPRSGGVNFSAI